MAIGYIGPGALDGWYSGSSPHNFPIQGIVPAGAWMVITLFDASGALTPARDIALTDSRGHSYGAVRNVQAVSGGASPAGLNQYVSQVPVALNAGDHVQVSWSGGAASFSCYAIEFANLNEETLFSVDGTYGPTGTPGWVTTQLGDFFDVYVGAGLWTAGVGQDSSGAWTDIIHGNDGHGNYRALAYHNNDNGFVADIPTSYHTTGSGTGRASSINLLADAPPTGGGTAGTVSAALFDDNTIPGGTRLDMTLTGASNFQDWGHSDTLPYLDGTDTYNYPRYPLLGALFVSQIVSFAFADDWETYILDDPRIITQVPAFADVQFTVQTTEMTDARWKIGGETAVNLGHNEDVMVYDAVTSFTPLIGTIIDGSGTHVGVPLVYGDTSAGVTFKLPRKTLDAAGILTRLTDLNYVETDAAVFNRISLSYSVLVQLYFPPEVFAPPPPPVLPVDNVRTLASGTAHSGDPVEGIARGT